MKTINRFAVLALCLGSVIGHAEIPDTDKTTKEIMKGKMIEAEVAAVDSDELWKCMIKLGDQQNGRIAAVFEQLTDDDREILTPVLTRTKLPRNDTQRLQQFLIKYGVTGDPLSNNFDALKKKLAELQAVSKFQNIFKKKAASFAYSTTPAQAKDDEKNHVKDVKAVCIKVVTAEAEESVENQLARIQTAMRHPTHASALKEELRNQLSSGLNSSESRDDIRKYACTIKVSESPTLFKKIIVVAASELHAVYLAGAEKVNKYSREISHADENSRTADYLVSKKSENAGAQVSEPNNAGVRNYRDASTTQDGIVCEAIPN